MSPLNKLLALAALFVPVCAFSEAPSADPSLEHARQISAQDSSFPQIQSVEVNGRTSWVRGQTDPAAFKAGDLVTLKGVGFGAGPDIDYSKVLIGNARLLERDLPMFEGRVNLLKQFFFELPRIVDSWPRDLKTWSDTRIDFTVPVTASQGPLVVQVQKRPGANYSLTEESKIFSLWDPLTERITARSFTHGADSVSTLGPPRPSNAVPVQVENPDFNQNVALGEAIFWAYEFNMGLVHHLRHLDWEKILSGKATDPVRGGTASPEQLFGAIPARQSEVPLIALQRKRFSPYPVPMPIKPLLRPALTEGWTTPTGYVGFVYAEAIDPIKNIKGDWIGMNCASCHAQRITYESAPGQTVSKVFPGLPNVHWSMKWNTLSNFHGVKSKEPGPNGEVGPVDKTQILYALPEGTGEHTLVRESNDGSIYANDYLFSPIAIPIITRHTPVRRALSRTEMIAGFEGSYIHAEEPDGALGALNASALKALTAYMTTLDSDHAVLQAVGMYRWLKNNGGLSEIGNPGEGEFVSRGFTNYAPLKTRVARGEGLFNRDCRSCHSYNFGTWTNEAMYPLKEVGTYFSPTLFQRQTQAIRTSILRDLFWVTPRGLLHDGHVKSLEDLVHPDRCREGSALYNRYYTLNASTFRIPKGTPAQERELRRHAYFTDVSWDKSSLYWDYQSMRAQFGLREFKAASPISLPAAPHPWCTQNASDINDLVLFLLTL